MKTAIPMLRRVLTPALLLCTILLFGSCEESHPPGPAPSGMVVSFLDKGAVVPDPVSTLVVIRPLRISSLSTQDGTTIHSWYSEIESQEYNRMVSIVQDNHLVGSPDPPVGSGRCVGAREMLVVMQSYGLVDTLTIAGVVRCDTTAWPAGLNSLVRMKDALVTKYGR
jgi:hypothetical protein